MNGWLHQVANSGPHTLNSGPEYVVILALLILAGGIMLGCLWWATLTGVFDDDEDES